MAVNKQTRSVSERRLSKLIQLASKYGIKRLKVGDVEFELHEPKRVIDKPTPLNQSIGESEKLPTDEELLYFSSPQYDVIQAQREAEKK